MREAMNAVPAAPRGWPFEVPVHALFEWNARTHPHREAVAFGGSALDCAELNREANVLAHWLVSMGVGAGHRVGVCLRPGFGILVALLAIHKAGGTYVPIDPDYPRERIRSIMEDAAPDLTISQDDVMERLDPILVHPFRYPLDAALSDPASSRHPCVPFLHLGHHRPAQRHPHQPWQPGVLRALRHRAIRHRSGRHDPDDRQVLLQHQPLRPPDECRIGGEADHPSPEGGGAPGRAAAAPGRPAHRSCCGI